MRKAIDDWKARQGHSIVKKRQREMDNNKTSKFTRRYSLLSKENEQKCKKKHREEEKAAFAFSFVLHSQTYMRAIRCEHDDFSFDDKRITYAAQNCPQLSMHTQQCRANANGEREKKTKICRTTRRFVCVQRLKQGI